MTRSRFSASGMMLIVCLLASACSSTTTSRANLVEQAYNTSGMVAMPTYKRTIFSSTDF